MKLIKKDPQQDKAIVKTKLELTKRKIHPFGKKFQSYMTEIEKYGKKALEAFKGCGEKRSSFRKSSL